MKNRSLRFLALTLSTLLCLGLIAAVWVAFRTQTSRPRLLVLPSSAVTVNHQTQFITFTNRPFVDRGKQFAAWQVAKLRGTRLQSGLSTEITLAGLANWYLSLNSFSGGVTIPVEFLEFKACFPTNCVLTNTSPNLRVFRATLEEVLDYNGVIGIREGPFVKLVRREWVQTNSAAKPNH